MKFLIVVALFLCQLGTINSLVLSDYGKICNVTDYGAIGDNITDNTIAIQTAINDCKQTTTTTTPTTGTTTRNLVLLPKQDKYSLNGIETVYISGSLFLVSNLVFFIDNDVRLLGTSNKSNISYPQIYTRNAGTMAYQHAALLNGGLCEDLDYNSSAIGDQCRHWNKLSNISIIGGSGGLGSGSIIDGNGHSGWYNAPYHTNDRPCLVNLMWITNLYISNVTLTNSPFWTLHPIFSSNIVIERVNIITDGPNTDGIDPDSCNNVIVRNCFISTGDDNIAIKSGKNADGLAVAIASTNIIIENTTMGNGDGLTIGSEMSGNVTNVIFRNIYQNGTRWGPKVKTCAQREGKLENITWENIVMNNVQTAVSISEFWGGDCDKNPNDTSSLPIVRDLVLKDITGNVTQGAGSINCLKQGPCVDFVMDNVVIKSPTNFSCENVYGTSNNVSPGTCVETQ